MRLHFIALFVFIAFISCVTRAESDDHTNNAISDSNYNGHTFRRLRRDRKLTEQEELVVDNEERGFGASANKLLSKLTARINVKKVAGAKTQTLSDEQVKVVTKEVAKEVNKNPRVWPTIRKGLKILYGTTLVTLIAVGVYGMVSALRNYT